MKVFDKYSTYYDLFYKDKDYKSESKYILDLIQEHNPTAKSILDFGCGTGKHAFHFAEGGFNVVGVDFSTSMIDVAQSNLQTEFKSQEANLKFVVGDMRNENLEQKFDVVLALFHVLSYQVTNKDLQDSIENFKRHLNPGGIVIADFWYGPGVLNDKPSVRVKRLENEDCEITRIAEPTIYPNQNAVDVNYSISIKDKSSGALDEIKECHNMRYLFKPELDLLFNSNNIDPISFHHWMTKKDPDFNSWLAVLVGKNQ